MLYQFTLTSKWCHCNLCRKFVYHDWSDDKANLSDYQKVTVYSFNNFFSAWGRHQAIKWWIKICTSLRHHGMGTSLLNSQKTYRLSDLVQVDQKQIADPLTYRG